MTKDQPAFMQYLAGWHHQLCNVLAMDLEGLLGWQYPSLAHSILKAFPHYDVLQKYLCLLTTFSISKDANYYQIESSQPCLERLASLCEQQFWWAPEVIATKLHVLVWEGATLHWLCRVSAWNVVWIAIGVLQMLMWTSSPSKAMRQEGASYLLYILSLTTLLTPLGQIL